MARGVKGTGRYSRARYTGKIHWAWGVVWVVCFLASCILAVGGK